MSEIKELQKILTDFRKERDWEQFHNPKDLSISLVLEASEVLEHFQWKSSEEMAKYILSNSEEIGDELADVFYWVLLLSHDLKIDLAEALRKKMLKNAEKYPLDKAHGNHKKYTELAK
jgi:dCTP diphosphatase